MILTHASQNTAGSAKKTSSLQVMSLFSKEQSLKTFFNWSSDHPVSFSLHVNGLIYNAVTNRWWFVPPTPHFAIIMQLSNYNKYMDFAIQVYVDSVQIHVTKKKEYVFSSPDHPFWCVYLIWDHSQHKMHKSHIHTEHKEKQQKYWEASWSKQHCEMNENEKIEISHE